MGKIYNVIVNYSYALSGSTTNNANYNIDWGAFLPDDKPLKLTFSYKSSTNYINGYRTPYLLSNTLQGLVNSAGQSSGAPTAPILGTLNISMINFSNNFGSYTSTPSDNPPVYLPTRPRNNNLNIQLYDNINNLPFIDNYWTVAGTGTATQSGFVLTIVSNTTGVITIGTVITIAGQTRTVVSFGTCTGSNTGTLLVDKSITVATATAYSFPASYGNYPAPYILTFSFEEVEGESTVL